MQTKLLPMLCVAVVKAQDIFVDKYWKHLRADSVAKPWLWRTGAE